MAPKEPDSGRSSLPGSSRRYGSLSSFDNQNDIDPLKARADKLRKIERERELARMDWMGWWMQLV
jgi:hypothetical protein